MRKIDGEGGMMGERKGNKGEMEKGKSDKDTRNLRKRRQMQE